MKFITFEQKICNANAMEPARNDSTLDKIERSHVLFDVPGLSQEKAYVVLWIERTGISHNGLNHVDEP